MSILCILSVKRSEEIWNNVSESCNSIFNWISAAPRKLKPSGHYTEFNFRPKGETFSTGNLPCIVPKRTWKTSSLVSKSFRKCTRGQSTKLKFFQRNGTREFFLCKLTSIQVRAERRQRNNAVRDTRVEITGGRRTFHLSFDFDSSIMVSRR